MMNLFNRKKVKEMEGVIEELKSKIDNRDKFIDKLLDERRVYDSLQEENKDLKETAFELQKENEELKEALKKRTTTIVKQNVKGLTTKNIINGKIEPAKIRLEVDGEPVEMAVRKKASKNKKTSNKEAK